MSRNTPISNDQLVLTKVLGKVHAGRPVFTTNVAETTNTPPSYYTKINLGWLIDLNIKVKLATV